MKKSAAVLVGLLGALWYPMPRYFSSPLDHNPIKPATEKSDSLLFLEKQKLADAVANNPARALAVAQSFLGEPYVHGCLECEKEEKLVVDLSDMDCWTLVENSVAIALAHNEQYEQYLARLQNLRYWGGKIDGYGSRIHYFSGWLLQAEKLGVLKDVTASLGGIHYDKKIGYISARPAKYPRIEDKKVLQDIQNAEKRINAHTWYYIPKNNIQNMAQFIQDGDIICLTSVKKDLDIAHQGFAIKRNGLVYLLHASSLAGRVIIARQPLAEYIATQRGQSGIMVIRLL
jgi:hypothetical protein